MNDDLWVDTKRTRVTNSFHVLQSLHYYYVVREGVKTQTKYTFYNLSLEPLQDAKPLPIFAQRRKDTTS